MRLRAPFGYFVDVRKVLVSFGEGDLHDLDRAAHHVCRPIDDPAVRGAFEQLLKMAERCDPISTAEALKARDRGRR